MGEPPVKFAEILRKLRAEAQLTQEELAEVSGVRPRTISDLERGVAERPRRETARRLADALNLMGSARAEFEAVARGRAFPAGAETAGHGGAAAATRTLPRDIVSFTGRKRELRELVNAMGDARQPGDGVRIYVIGGMAGVGKTSFAVHAAHQLADRFPSGQIFLALHGHTPGRRPTAPGDALASLLLTIGVSAAQIPPDPEERAALWRDRLADWQLLLVLDDAVGSEQVRPLLPGAGGSLVLVTSRRHLSALDDASTISLDTLPPDEAATLLTRLAGRAGLDPDDPPVQEIARLCGYLPLAIGMVARQLHHHPAWSLTGRAAELTAARDRLKLMAAENLSVTAAFDLSYADLTADQQRLFRRLGLHPGSEFDAYAVAALDGTELSAAHRGLEALYDYYLLDEPAQDRYRMHDLIREHARALAQQDGPQSDREDAIARLLNYYQDAAARADRLITRQARPVREDADARPPVAVFPLSSPEQALTWARTERGSLLSCLGYVTAAGQGPRVIALTAGLSGVLRRDGPWTDAVTRHIAAIQAAQQLGDRLGHAGALHDLGDVLRMVDDYPAAAQAQERALGIYRELGDRLGQANALHDLGVVKRMTGAYPAGALALEQALGIYRDLGDWRGQANALRELGVVRLATGDYGAAAQAQEMALGICRDLGDRSGQANALRYLGIIGLETGAYPASVLALEQALSIYRDLGDRLGQANALRYLGGVRRMTGDHSAGAEALQRALDTFRELGDRSGEAATLADLGSVQATTGEYQAASRIIEQALVIYREIGDRGGEAAALNEKGTLLLTSGELVKAAESYQQGLELARTIASSLDEARALAGLGRCALAYGHPVRAGSFLRQALEISQRIGAAEAPGLVAELNVLAGP